MGTPATHGDVHELAAALGLGEDGYRRAFELAGLAPARGDWLRWLDRFLTATGALLVVAGIAAFFAWNWAGLHHFAKFALIQAGIVGAVLIAWRLRIDTVGGRASLFAAAFLIGVLLAVLGQVYQTGADPYGLFVAWAVLVLPWAIVGRQAGLWLLLQVLLNLALIMYWTQVLEPPDGWWDLNRLLGPLVWLGTTLTDSELASWVFALNVLAVVLWEAFASRDIVWLQGRTYPRLIGSLALTAVIVPTLVLVFAASASAGQTPWRLNGLSPGLFAAALAVVLWYYQYRKPDLYMLTAALFGLIMVVMALAIRHLFQDLGSLFLLALLLVAQVAGAAMWLKRVGERRRPAG